MVNGPLEAISADLGVAGNAAMQGLVSLPTLPPSSLAVTHKHTNLTDFILDWFHPV